MHEILQFDTELFLKIHRGLSNSFFDFIMPWLRNRYFWVPLYIFIAVFCIKQYKKTGLYIIIGLLLTFALGDLISAKLIKPYVNRSRPCKEITLAKEIIPRVHCSGGKSFPSSHATNHFGIAVFLISIFYSRWKHILPIALIWATSICFAQIYVGVHYPIDIFCGAILGSLIGLFTSAVFKRLKPVM